MGDVEFHQTRMGRTFYEHTMPELARQLARIASALETLAPALPDPAEATPKSSEPSVPDHHED